MYRMNVIVGDQSTQTMKEALLVDIRLRWIIAAISIPVVVIFWKLSKHADMLPFIIMAITVIAMNVGYGLYVKNTNKHLNEMFLATGLADILLVTFFVGFTGGMKSPFFLIYYFVLLDACFDFWSNRFFYYFAGFIVACYTAL